jgi:hypothetical protein
VTLSDSPEMRGFRAWWRKIWKKTDPEAQRRRWLQQFGRIAEGEVMDVQTSAGEGRAEGAAAARRVLYRYEVAGVAYECSHALDAAQMQNAQSYWLGKRISVRYDPRYPASSIVV